jgi:hypothetical protein
MQAHALCDADYEASQCPAKPALIVPSYDDEKDGECLYDSKIGRV